MDYCYKEYLGGLHVVAEIWVVPKPIPSQSEQTKVQKSGKGGNDTHVIATLNKGISSDLVQVTLPGNVTMT